MDKYALVGNGPISNRGCEAIVLGTKAIVERAFGQSEFLLASFADDDPDSLPDNIHPIALPYQRPRWSRAWFKHRSRRLFGLPEDFSDVLTALKGKLDNTKAVFSIGGDGYAIDFGHQIVNRLIILGEYAKQQGIPVIIWGASIGPFDNEPEFERKIVEHFRDIALIVVREHRSEAYLRNLGLTDNVCLAPDPAFVLGSTPCSLPDNIEEILEAGGIGLNLSPLIASFATDGDLDRWAIIATELVETILSVSSRPLLLIYHVRVSNRVHSERMDDLAFLSNVLGNLPHTLQDRVALVPDGLNCLSLKWIISRTHLFIGARTHSTIAALSSQVPCISIAYSVKAWGINELVFGHTNWVIPSPMLTASTLGLKLKELDSQYNNIKARLSSTIPMLIKSAFHSGQRVKAVIE